MFTFISSLLTKLPGPWRVGVEVGLAVLLIVLGFFLFGQIKACGYNKAYDKYQADSKAWSDEKAKLLGGIAERDKQIELLKAKEAAIIAADQAGKKLDDEIAQKIDAATQAAANEAIVTDQPADCWVRADRTCAKLAGLKPPIKLDCDAYKRKICSGQ